MAVAVIMPKSGQSVESCILTQWHKQVGDPVQEGELLFSYETDKASFEEKAGASGTLLARFFEEDDDIPVLVTIAVIGQAGEDISAFASAGGQPVDAAPPTVPVKAPGEASGQGAVASTVAEKTPGGASGAAGAAPGAASPRAKAFAARANIPLEAATGTGPQGRILERDVMAVARLGVQPQGQVPAVREPATPAVLETGLQELAYREEKLSNIRKVIARSMQESLQNSAQLTNTLAFDATELLQLRAKLKGIAAADDTFPNITINDMLLYAVSRVLPRHPLLNAHFLGDRMRYFSRVNLGIAVDTPRGLLVPTLFGADQKPLRDIAQESKALAKAAQSGAINPDVLTGGTFTISNLGALGTEFFTPILNPPQTGILGVGCAVERVRMVNGVVSTYPAIGLSLTYDHRAVDGAPAARFLQELKRELENFTGLLV